MSSLITIYCRPFLQISQLLVQYDFFVCPIGYDEATESLSMTCQRSAEFLPASYSLPAFIAKTGALVSCNGV